MVRRKKTESSSNDVISPGKVPNGFLIVDSAVWWGANPDKSKKYKRKEFRGKKEIKVSDDRSKRMFT